MGKKQTKEKQHFFVNLPGKAVAKKKKKKVKIQFSFLKDIISNP